MDGRRRVLVVGLGTIAGTHLEVLAADPGYEVVGGVDPSRTPRRHVAPLFGDLDQAFAAGIDADLVVVATPTPTHVRIVSDLLVRCDAAVLSEKPLATTAAEIRSLDQAHGHDRVAARVHVAHHFAFSPEVEWARRLVQQHGWGPPTTILSVFNDAYARLPDEQRAGYVSTWVDSGPNQLSVVAAFVTGWRVVAHDDAGDRAVTTLEHDGGRAVLTSNWRAADTSKQTTLRFEEVGVEVRIDHTSMTGLVLRSGEVVEHVGYSGTAGRKFAHYEGLYRVLREDPADRRLGVALAAEIAALLESGGEAPAGGRLTWSSIGTH